MPRLIIIGVVLIGGWIAWKALKREMARVGRKGWSPQCHCRA